MQWVGVCAPVPQRQRRHRQTPDTTDSCGGGNSGSSRPAISRRTETDVSRQGPDESPVPSPVVLRQGLMDNHAHPLWEEPASSPSETQSTFTGEEPQRTHVQRGLVVNNGELHDVRIHRLGSRRDLVSSGPSRVRVRVRASEGPPS